MAGNALEQLGIRIENPAEKGKVTRADVEAAFEARREELTRNDNLPSHEKVEAMERAVAMKEKFLKEIGEAAAKTSEKKEAVKDETAAAVAIQKRLKLMGDANDTAKALCDPTADGAAIPDWKGWSWFGVDENEVNPTIFLARGVLTGLGVSKQGSEKAEFAKMVAIYENSDSGWLNLNVDKVLDYEPMVDGLGIKPYLTSLEGFDLANEPLGYMVGLLMSADRDGLGGRAAEYKKYVNGELHKLKDAKKLNFDAEDANDAYTMDHHLKGQSQMRALAAIASPAEWLAPLQEMAGEFTKLKEKGLEVAGDLGFEYENAQVKSFLEAGEDVYATWSPDRLHQLEMLMKNEALQHTEASRTDNEMKMKEAEQSFEALKEANKAGVVTEDEMKTLEKSFAEIRVSISETTPGNVDSLDEVGNFANKLAEVKNDILALQRDIAGYKAKIEEEGKKKEEEKKKTKPAVVPGGGKPGEPGGPEQREVFENLEAFLKGKYLEEAEEEGKHLYVLNDESVYTKFSTSGGINRTELVFKNPEVAKYFGKDANEFLALFHERYLLKAGNSSVKHIWEGQFSGGSGAKRLDLSNAFARKDSPEAVAAVDEFNRILGTALEESRMRFDERPPLSEMEEEYYGKKFVPAWKKASGEMKELNEELRKKEKLAIPGTLPGELPGGVPGGLPGAPRGPEAPVDHEFMRALGGPPVVEYAGAIKAIYLHGNTAKGVNFELPSLAGYGGKTFHCHVSRSAEGRYSLKYEGGTKRYNSVYELVHEINSGRFHQLEMQRILKAENVYKPFEKKIGTVRTLEEGRPGVQGELHLELDWNNPNAEIYMTAQPHGRIAYTIQRKNVGPQNQERWSGYANSFGEFMSYLEYQRNWAERGDEGRR